MIFGHRKTFRVHWVVIGSLEGVPDTPGRCMGLMGQGGEMMTHKYRGSIVVLSISKSVEPNEEQKEMTSGFQ